MIKVKNLVPDVLSEKRSNDLHSDPRVSNRLDFLIQLGFTQRELQVETDHGLYYITLPDTAYSMDVLKHISSGFDKKAMLGQYPNVSNGSLSIRTNITVK